MNLEISDEERLVLLRGLFSLQPSPSGLIQRIVDLRHASAGSLQESLEPVAPPKQPDRPVAPAPAPASSTLVNEPPKVFPPVPPTSTSLSPLIEEVEVEMEVGTGKNKRFEPRKLMQCEGVVVSVSPVKKSQKGSEFITVVIAGLPDGPETKTITPHSQFHCFHKDSLFPVLKLLKAKSRITFQYDPTIKADDPKKLVWQNIEGISMVDGVEYVEGKPVTRDAANPNETSSSGSEAR